MLLALGVGLFIYVGSRALSIEGEDAVAMVATVSTAIGVGLLMAAGASYGMSRRMGLLSYPTEDTRPADVA